MSPAIIDVDPDTFDAASKVFGVDIGNALDAAQRQLVGALSEVGSMAGSDHAGMAWAEQYDPAAQGAMGVVTDLWKACTNVAALLQRTGFNHGQAESASDPTRTTPTPADDIRYIVLPGIEAPTLPTAAGGSSSPPHGWGIVSHAVGYVWPNGHPGTLRTAAQAWDTAANSIDAAGSFVTEAVEAVATQRSPEVDDALSVCTAMAGHISDTAHDCRSLGRACTELATYIDKAHTDIENELSSFLEWTAGIEAVGGLLGAISFGAAEVPTQGVEAGRIAITGARIGRIIDTLITAARGVATTISTVITRVGEVASRLKVIVGARLSEAAEAIAARVPSLADDTGSISFGRLGVWQKGWSTRGLEIETKLGGNLPRSFPTVDKFEDGVATSIKSVDLSAPGYQSTSRLTSRINGYINKVSKFDGATWGGREIDGDDIVGRQLQVAIQPGVASPDQLAVLNQLRSVAKSRGVTMVITEVP